MNNKYIYRSRISEGKFREILKLFAQDLSAVDVSEISGISRVTINKIFYELRVKIYDYQNSQLAQFSGEVELDESYFGARRVRGKRGRGVRGKTIVFGLLKRDGNVYYSPLLCFIKSVYQKVISLFLVWLLIFKNVII